MKTLRVNNIVSRVTRRKFRVSLTVSPHKNTYKSYDTPIRIMFDNLTERIMRDYDKCLLEFPDEDVFLTITSFEGEITNHRLSEPKK